MRRRLTFVAAVSALAMLNAGCYNNPHTSMKHPGEGPEHVHAGPAVGPGTIDGGSTAGPQPPPRAAHGSEHTQPQPGGATQHGAPEAGVMGSPRPVTDGSAHGTPAPAARTGNEKGGDGRGPDTHAEGKH